MCLVSLWLILSQKSLFSLLWTPCVTGAFALIFLKYHIPAPMPIAPATETAVTLPIKKQKNKDRDKIVIRRLIGCHKSTFQSVAWILQYFTCNSSIDLLLMPRYVRICTWFKQINQVTILLVSTVVRQDKNRE